MTKPVLAWVIAALLIASASVLVLSNAPVVAGPDDGRTSGSGEAPVETTG
jgi:hypothetical protein